MFSLPMKDGKVFFQTRGGEAYPIIEDMAQELREVFFDEYPHYFVDFELFCKDMHLEDIVSAAKKHNEDTPKLQAHVFDLVDLKNNV